MNNITIFSGDWPVYIAYEDETETQEPAALTPQQRAIFDRECKRLCDENVAGEVRLAFAGGLAKSLQVVRTLAWDDNLDLEAVARQIAASTGYGVVGIELAGGKFHLRVMQHQTVKTGERFDRVELGQKAGRFNRSYVKRMHFLHRPAFPTMLQV